MGEKGITFRKSEPFCWMKMCGYNILWLFYCCVLPLLLTQGGEKLSDPIQVLFWLVQCLLQHISHHGSLMSSVSSAKPQKGESENKRKTPIGFGNVNPMSTGPVFDSLDWFPGRGELLGVEAGAEGPAMGKGVSMESPKCIFFRQNRWQRPHKKASCFFLMWTKTAAEFIVTKEGRQHDNRHLVLPLSRKIGSIISAFLGFRAGLTIQHME